MSSPGRSLATFSKVPPSVCLAGQVGGIFALLFVRDSVEKPGNSWPFEGNGRKTGPEVPTSTSGKLARVPR